MFTKSQLFTAAVAAASASTVLAAPMYGDATDLEVRGPGASKEIKDNIAKVAGSKAGRKAAVELGKNVYTKVAGNALDEQKKKDAAKQNQHHGGSKRDLEDILDELFARGPGASKELKDNIAKVAGSKAGRKAAVELGKNVYTKVAGNALDEQKKKDAAKQNQHHGGSKRDLEEVLDELFARGPGASKELKDNIAKVAGSKAGRKAAVELGKNVYTKVAGNALDEQKKKDAAKQNQHHGSSKRDLEDALEEFFAREFDDLEDLYARGPGASKELKDNIAKVAGSKAGRKAAVELGKNVYTKVAGNALDEQKKKDAAKQNQHHGSSKRDLEDMLEDLFSREFDDLEELYARGPGASKELKDNIAKVAGSKAGRKAAVELGKNVYTKVAGNALDEQKKKDAAKQNQHHGSSKRDLEEALEEMFAREFDDLEDLYARGPGASKELKDNIAKVAGSKAGRKAAVELGKNVYTKVAGNALDEQKKKDAAKQNQHHGGSSKRDLEDPLEDLFARGPGASKELKDNIAKVAGSKAGRKAAVELGKNVYTKVAGNALDEQKKKDAAKQNQHHGSSKRDLLELFERELELYDELD